MTHVTEESLLERIKPETRPSSLVGLFEILAIADRTFVEPQLLWVAKSGQGTFTLEQTTEDDKKTVGALLSSEKIKRENARFYDSLSTGEAFAAHEIVPAPSL